MKVRLTIASCSALVLGAAAQDNSSEQAEADVAFREPFSLKLHLDEEHYYEHEFPKIPYVHDGNVYLFSGEEFGISLTIAKDEVKGIDYVEDPQKADVAFNFYQRVSEDRKKALMMCGITNNTKHEILFDALMTVPRKEGVYETTILPLKPGLKNFESWPHPILQLVLRNIRLKENSPGTNSTQPEKKSDGSGN